MSAFQEESTKAGSIMKSLSEKSKEWISVPINEKIELLDEICSRSGDFGVGYGMAKAHMEARQIFENSKDGAGFVGGYGVLVVLAVSLYCCHLATGLKELDKPNKKIDFAKEFDVETTATAYDVDTDSITELRTILFSTASELSKGNFYKSPHEGQVAVVLGAGNHPFLCLSDALYHMFVEGRVAVIKHHPLQRAAHEQIEYMLQPLLSKGYLVSLPDADLDYTKELMYSEHTHVVHLTGGLATHNAIVWGADGQQDTRKQQNAPLLKAKMHSELGAVTPYVVVPSAGYQAAKVEDKWTSVCENDEWTQERVDYYANAYMMALADNCSCNCLALTVVILPVGELGDKFEAAFKAAAAKMLSEPAWYPGMQQRYDAWISSVKKCNADIQYYSAGKKAVGCPADQLYLDFGIACMGIVTASDLKNIGHRFPDLGWATDECFAPLACIVRMEGSTPEEFCKNAFCFANNCLWGNLSCAVTIPPSTQHLAVSAVCSGDLMYGTVVLNSLTNFGYQLKGYWGGPSHANNSLADAQSGTGGTVSNSYMIDQPRNALCIRKFNSKGGIDGLPNVGAFTSKTLGRVLAKGWGSLLPWK